jgi:hypothetical protein
MSKVGKNKKKRETKILAMVFRKFQLSLTIIKF